MADHPAISHDLMQQGHFPRRSTPSRPGHAARAGATVPALVAGAAALALLAAAVPRPAGGLAREKGRYADVRIDVVVPDFACDARLDDPPLGAGPLGRVPPARDAQGTDLSSGMRRLRDALYSRAGSSRRSGDGYRIECLDPETSVTWRFDLERVERRRTLDGGTLIAAHEARHAVEAPREKRLVAGATVAETVSLPPPAAWRAGPEGDAIVAFLGARRAGAGGGDCSGTSAGRCSTTRDIVWRARSAGRAAVVIEQEIWVNGLAAERAVWRLGG